MAGLSATPETLAFKTIYSDDTCVVTLTVTPLGLLIGAVKLATLTKATRRHWMLVMDELEQMMKDRGITEYYALVGSADNYRFAKHFGFKTEKITIGPTFELMRKEIG